MSNISSNSLFHFTSKRDYLINILKNEFIPRYVLEEIPLSKHLKRPKIESAIPMVCFCPNASFVVGIISIDFFPIKKWHKYLLI